MEQVLAVDASKNIIELVIVGLDRLASKIPSETISVLEKVQYTKEADKSLVEAIMEAAKGLKHSWESAVLLLPGHGQLSMNITMPFRDARRVAKLITAEVEDTLPIETKDFVLDFTHTGSLDGAGEDFHVGLYPAAAIEEVTKGLQDSALEPRIITTPSIALGSLYEVFKDELDPNAVILYETADWLYFSIILDGKIVADRAIQLSLAPIGQCEGLIEASIRATEIRYDKLIKTIYRISETAEASRITTIGQRAIKELSMISLFPAAKERVSLPAIMAALYAQEYPAPKILNNFRAGIFAYRPSLLHVKQGLRTLLPYFMLAAIVIVVSLTGWYVSRAYTIHALRDQLSSIITKDIPKFTAEPGNEAKTLQGMSQGLQDALKDLGSPLTTPPLQVLSALSEDLSSIEGITVSRATIRNGEVKIDGSVPNYRNLNKLEATLKKRKGMFCRFKTDTSTASSREGGREFQLTLTLCD